MLRSATDGDSGDDRELARQICEACVEGTGVDGAALSLLTVSVHRETLYSTDPTATALEDLQFTLGEGACIEAATSGRPVLVDDLRDRSITSRWPVFAGAVAERTDVAALFALPLQLGSINLGVIDLYRTTPGPMQGAELRDVLAAVDTATLTLLGAQFRTDAEGQPDHLRGDPAPWDGRSDDRAEVHQATGMLVVQLGVPARDAFVRLRAYAFADQRALSEVAGDVVARRLVFTDDIE